MQQCPLLNRCNPEQQRNAKPYGTEWIKCKKEGLVVHCYKLRCLDKKPLKLDIDDEVVNLYNNNISIRQISEDLECSISHVKNVLKRYNLYKPQKERSKLYLLLPYKATLLYLRFEKDMKFAALIRYVKQNYDIDVSLNHLREILNNWRKEENEGNQIK